MVDDKRQVERFLHVLDPLIQAKVAMWKLTTMANTMSLARQAQKRIDMEGHLSRKCYVSFKEPFGEEVIKVGGCRYGFCGKQDNVSRLLT